MNSQLENLSDSTNVKVQPERSATFTAAEKPRTPHEFIEHIATQRTKQLQAKSVIAVCLCVLFLCVAGFFIWRTVRPYLLQEDHYQKIDSLKEAGKFSEARTEVSREKAKHANLWDYLRIFFEERTENRSIDAAEKQALLNDGLTLGQTQKQFKGQNYQTVKKYLKKRGFTNVHLAPMVKNDKTPEGAVTKIKVDGKTNFKADDHFFSNVYIEIQYRTRG